MTDALRPYEINEGLLVPMDIALRMAVPREISAITVRLKPDADSQAGMRQITDWYARVAPDVPIDCMSAEQLIEQMQRQMRLFTLLLGAIGSISLIVGGVGVMNVMLVSVTERRREIGIRRALGARRRDIQIQFLVEALLLCSAGGLLGAGVGALATRIVSHFCHWQFVWTSGALILAIAVSSVIGVFFGFYPAGQAARLNPIVALREE